MTFLHKLYSLFDETIQYFDAYKVETIGDAYMVSSGVPEPTELHAANVCSFALELLENMKDFKISEDSLPNERVNIRIGIHSGKHKHKALICTLVSADCCAQLGLCESVDVCGFCSIDCNPFDP